MNDIPYHRPADNVFINVRDETSVEFHRVELYVGKNGKIGVARAEIVKRKFKPETAKFVHHTVKRTAFHITSRFRNLHFYKIHGKTLMSTENGKQRTGKRIIKGS